MTRHNAQLGRYSKQDLRVDTQPRPYIQPVKSNQAREFGGGNYGSFGVGVGGVGEVAVGGVQGLGTEEVAAGVEGGAGADETGGQGDVVSSAGVGSGYIVNESTVTTADPDMYHPMYMEHQERDDNHHLAQWARSNYTGNIRDPLKKIKSRVNMDNVGGGRGIIFTRVLIY